jgi:hypothetical protein
MPSARHRDRDRHQGRHHERRQPERGCVDSGATQHRPGRSGHPPGASTRRTVQRIAASHQFRFFTPGELDDSSRRSTDRCIPADSSGRRSAPKAPRAISDALGQGGGQAPALGIAPARGGRVSQPRPMRIAALLEEKAEVGGSPRVPARQAPPPGDLGSGEFTGARSARTGARRRGTRARPSRAAQPPTAERKLAQELVATTGRRRASARCQVRHPARKRFNLRLAQGWPRLASRGLRLHHLARQPTKTTSAQGAISSPGNRSRPAQTPKRRTSAERTIAPPRT